MTPAIHIDNLDTTVIRSQLIADLIKAAAEPTNGGCFRECCMLAAGYLSRFMASSISGQQTILNKRERVEYDNSVAYIKQHSKLLDQL